MARSPGFRRGRPDPLRKLPQRGSERQQQAFPETDLAAVLEYYGATVPNRHGWVKIRCVVHNDSTPSMTVNVESGGFNCMACGAKGGDGLQLVRLVEDCDFPTAVKKYAEITGVEVKTGSSGPQTARRVASGGFAPKFARPRRPSL